MKSIFTTSEKNVIMALYRLDRYSNANEISKVSGVSWATVKKVLESLYKNKKILSRKIINDSLHYIIELQ